MFHFQNIAEMEYNMNYVFIGVYSRENVDLRFLLN